MSISSPQSAQRLRSMLYSAMGPELVALLKEPHIFEVMANPDGVVRVDRQGDGRSDTGLKLEAVAIERIIRLVASHHRFEIHADQPIISAELPIHTDGQGGERFEGLLAPVVSSPCFSIRKPAYRLYTLDDYVSAKIMTATQADILREAVRTHRNIIVAGGTSSGKTTLTNALLAEVARSNERVILIEDTQELQCCASDVVALRTRAGQVSLRDLVRSTLRLRPDRIIIGEVRGAEALDLLKAWNTGHPGGIATLHANSAKGALLRLEQLVQEAVINVPRALIAEAIDVVIYISGEKTYPLHRRANYDQSQSNSGYDTLSLNAFDCKTSGTPSVMRSRCVEDLVELTGLSPDGDYQLRQMVLNESV